MPRTTKCIATACKTEKQTFLECSKLLSDCIYKRSRNWSPFPQHRKPAVKTWTGSVLQRSTNWGWEPESGPRVQQIPLVHKVLPALLIVHLFNHYVPSPGSLGFFFYHKSSFHRWDLLDIIIHYVTSKKRVEGKLVLGMWQYRLFYF